MPTGVAHDGTDSFKKLNIRLPAKFTKPVEQPRDFVVDYDAWPAFEFFLKIQAYWLHGFGGITGLDHGAVIGRIKLFESSRSKQQRLLECLEAIEQGALQAWADKRAEDDDKKPDKQRVALTATQKKSIDERKSWRC
ncbi:DUF1799 domain-containing protein [Methylovulum psychrotolerans]|uniref:Uncharacterized protein n=1 Tax=Methylovulum psychrotolerans TaxID=1704499 RepID=A0A2S5CGH8_9GAMM|nr:DUF1799 domain-containing protein [Methylovulum psychrotolerans]POZ49905.1 hypothetical protein AADEFJLK_04351 [Methylovulum psychrotolerans]